MALSDWLETYWAEVTPWPEQGHGIIGTPDVLGEAAARGYASRVDRDFSHGKAILDKPLG
ncbi:hypothetical protein [Kitasatospora sp. Root107]|uniref:hypothetical protein n=1 Tax=Kitasatospora sp. Root107 TaxID=1736424 RepID=UPI000708DD1F|nr:hypothetical protein [Kitasatospora sp. Root107]KQV15947.1 hypothetical protein ASC99_28810 [Kitasatospora sp. Root107]